MELFRKIYYFQQVTSSPFHQLSYVIGCQETAKACIIDPSLDYENCVSLLDKNSLKLEALLLTHSHADQLESLLELCLNFDLKIYAHPDGLHKLSYIKAHFISVLEAHKISLGNLTFQAFHTPGHTPDSLCFLLENKLFTGDTLHIGGCGRCDLPQSDPASLYDSLYRKIKSLPMDLKVYPSHHYGIQPTSTLREEFKNNPYLQFSSEEEFILYRK
ncbi:MAG: MBL fold metallo-hydrolase [Deltaproteobacteria bacterium]|nr:MBL fold metallo-hydrolase [Deltaproteobacteria bacterium]